MKETGIKLHQLNEERWLANYNDARNYFETNGKFPTLKENARLYQWASQWWRNTYLKNPADNTEKAERLLGVGYNYKTGTERFDQIWMKNYEEAKAFFNEHGHFPSIRENKKIRSWVRTWWNVSAAKHPDKVKLLQAIGYNYETVEQHSEKLWNECYIKAKAFFNEHGHFPKKGECGNLRNWATRWWSKSADEQPEKAKMLIEIGFNYCSVEEVYEQKWMKNYEAAKAFFNEHEHFPTEKENQKLYGWARTWWRESYQKYPEKNSRKAELLNNIGFNYDVNGFDNITGC